MSVSIETETAALRPEAVRPGSAELDDLLDRIEAGSFERERTDTAPMSRWSG